MKYRRDITIEEFYDHKTATTHLHFYQKINMTCTLDAISMNPARSLAPALVSGVLGNLWLYWSATFVGTSIVAIIFNGKFVRNNS